MGDSTAVVLLKESCNLQATDSIENWDLLLESFLNSLDVKENSRETYYWAMIQYMRWVKESHRTLKSLTPADIVCFKKQLLSDGLSELTVSVYLTAVRQFYNWTETSLFYPNIARSVKPPRSPKMFKKMHLSFDESRELLDYLKGKSLRDYAMINLILRTGLRTIEVSRADIGDIQKKYGRRILRVWGKGMNEKNNLVILSDPAWIPIKEYLETRPDADESAPLFVTEGKGHRGKRISTRSIQYVCKEAMRNIGLDSHEYSPHSLRHTTAVSILKSGGDWKDVQRVLRHSSPSVSQIYTASIEQEVHLERNPEGLLDDVF